MKINTLRESLKKFLSDFESKTSLKIDDLIDFVKNLWRVDDSNKLIQDIKDSFESKSSFKLDEFIKFIEKKSQDLVEPDTFIGSIKEKFGSKNFWSLRKKINDFIEFINEIQKKAETGEDIDHTVKVIERLCDEYDPAIPNLKCPFTPKISLDSFDDWEQDFFSEIESHMQRLKTLYWLSEPTKYKKVISEYKCQGILGEWLQNAKDPYFVRSQTYLKLDSYQGEDDDSIHLFCDKFTNINAVKLVNIKAQVLNTILPCVISFPKIIELRLINLELTSDHYKIISGRLSRLRLKTLSIINSNFYGKNFQRVFKTLHHAYIEFFDIGCNALGPDEAFVLKCYLYNFRNMQYFNLGNNMLKEDSELSKVLKLLMKKCKLNHLASSCKKIFFVRCESCSRKCKKYPEIQKKIHYGKNLEYLKDRAQENLQVLEQAEEKYKRYKENIHAIVKELADIQKKIQNILKEVENISEKITQHGGLGLDEGIKKNLRRSEHFNRLMDQSKYNNCFDFVINQGGFNIWHEDLDKIEKKIENLLVYYNSDQLLSPLYLEKPDKLLEKNPIKYLEKFIQRKNDPIYKYYLGKAEDPRFIRSKKKLKIFWHENINYEFIVLSLKVFTEVNSIELHNFSITEMNKIMSELVPTNILEFSFINCDFKMEGPLIHHAIHKLTLKSFKAVNCDFRKKEAIDYNKFRIVFGELKYKSLEVLDLSSNRLGENIGNIISASFIQFKNLEFLYLKNNFLKKSLLKICECILTRSKLKVLDISQNDLKYEDIDLCLKELTKLSQLISLDISGNDINNPENLRDILEAYFPNFKSLTTIKVDHEFQNALEKTIKDPDLLLSLQYTR
jgi:tetrahydromethanopterin S-methyltransferase subunit G